MIEVEQLGEYRRHAEWALAAAVAHELDLFAALHEGAKTPAGVAEDRGVSERGARVLLGALEGMGLVVGEGECFALTRQGRDAFVDRDSGRFQGDALRSWYGNVRRWANHLEDVVRSGSPPEKVEAPGTGESTGRESLARFMAAMDSKSAEQVAAVVEGCMARVPDARSVLDLGGGPGTFARAFADQGVEATLFDRPEVVDHVAEAYGLAVNPRVHLQRGDFLAQPPEGEFDVVLLGNITHIYDPETNRRLLVSLHPHVREGGVVAILDFVRGRSPFAPLFAVTMLMSTETGNTYSLPEYEEWLLDAGYREVRMADVDTDRQLVTALR